MVVLITAMSCRNSGFQVVHCTWSHQKKAGATQCDELFGGPGGGGKLPFGDNVLLTQSFQVYRGWLGVPGNEAVTHVAYAAQPSSIKLAQSDHPLSSLPLQTWLP